MPDKAVAMIAVLLFVSCHRDKVAGAEGGAGGGRASLHPGSTASAAAKGMTSASATDSVEALPPPRGNVARYRLRNQNLTDAELAKWLSKLPEPTALTSLDVRDNQLTAASIEALAQSKLGSFEVLTLSGNPLGDAAARSLAMGGKFQNTRVLWLADTKLSAVGADALLGPSSKFTWLRELNLNGNSLGDSGVENLAKAKKAKTLSHLYLSKVGMTDRGAKALAASPHLVALERLDVTENTLTKEGVAALKQSPRFAKTTVDVDAP